MDRNQLLKEKEKSKTNNGIPFITTFNKSLPDIKKVINKTWNLLQISDSVKQSFKEKPFIAYRRNRNLRDILGQTTIINNQVKRKKDLKKGKSSQCLSKYANSLCCKQMESTTTFRSNITKQKFDIYHNSNCRSRFVIYLMECRKCKIQYVGKTTTQFNIRLNKHRSDSFHPNTDTIPADLHFSNNNHNFTNDAAFTIIEQIQDRSKTEEEKGAILLKRENFWIKKLQTLTPNGLNQELNNIA